MPAIEQGLAAWTDVQGRRWIILNWPVPPVQCTRIFGSRTTALRYRAEQGHTESLIAFVDPNQTRPQVNQNFQYQLYWGNLA